MIHFVFFRGINTIRLCDTLHVVSSNLYAFLSLLFIIGVCNVRCEKFNACLCECRIVIRINRLTMFIMI